MFHPDAALPCLWRVHARAHAGGAGTVLAPGRTRAQVHAVKTMVTYKQSDDVL